jgi:hypothetical protein
MSNVEKKMPYSRVRSLNGKIRMTLFSEAIEEGPVISLGPMTDRFMKCYGFDWEARLAIRDARCECLHLEEFMEKFVEDEIPQMEIEYIWELLEMDNAFRIDFSYIT